MGDQEAGANDCDDHCPARATIVAIGGRWKIYIFLYIYPGKLRFSEPRRKIRGVSQKMLTEQLREMEGHGLLTRTVHPEVPPRVEYEVTPLGESLRPVVLAMGDWGREYGDRIGPRPGG